MLLYLYTTWSLRSMLMYAMRRSCTLYMPPIQALSGGGAWGCAHLLGGGRDPPTGLSAAGRRWSDEAKPLLSTSLNTRARA